MRDDPSDPRRPSTSAGPALSFRATLAFYIPLAVSVLILGMTRTTLNAGMGRGTADAGIQIGAFAAAVGLAWILMAFVFPVREACLSFLRGPATYRQLRRLALVVGLLSVGVGGLLFAGPWGKTLLEVVMGLRGELLDATLAAVRILCLSPPLLAWQRLNQGALMWLRATRPLTVISIVKYGLLIGAVVVSLLIGVRFTAAVAAWVLNLADATEGLLLELAVLRLRANLRGPERPLSAATCVRFFVPLGMRELIMDCVRPVISAGLARSPEPELALAAFGVAIGLNQIIERPLFAFRHTAMALVRDAQSCALVRRFSLITGGLVLTLVLAVTWSPAIIWLCGGVLGLGPELLEPSIWATRIILLEVALQPTRAFYHGILLNDFRNWVLTSSSAVRAGVAFLIGFVAVPFLPLPSYVGGALAYLLAVTGDTLVVNLSGRATVRRVYGLLPDIHPGQALAPGQVAAD